MSLDDNIALPLSSLVDAIMLCHKLVNLGITKPKVNTCGLPFAFVLLATHLQRSPSACHRKVIVKKFSQPNGIPVAKIQACEAPSSCVSALGGRNAIFQLSGVKLTCSRKGATCILPSHMCKSTGQPAN